MPGEHLCLSAVTIGEIQTGIELTREQDAMIAAVAMVHRLAVVTRNVRDFEPFEVGIIDPFE